MSNERSVDVCVVGAGIAGSACARELARYKLDIAVIEANYDLACGASRTNSGIVHGGYDPSPATHKARFNVEGARLIPQLAEELGFRYINNGSMVVAFSDGEVAHVQQLIERGHTNGAQGVRFVEHDELLAMEPNLNPQAKAALLCSSSGIVDPFGMTVAYAENAACNGVKFTFNTRVVDIVRDGRNWRISLSDGSTLLARSVVNAAGVHAVDIHNLVSENKLISRPRLGEYLLMSRDMGQTFSHTMFQTPSELGKGVLVSPTVEGNLIVGPDAIDVEDPEDTATRPEGLAQLVVQAKRTWPAYDGREVIVNFAGVRPTASVDDFVIGEPEDAPGFFEIAAFDSPGLTSAPAVALHIAEQIACYLGAEHNTAFIGHRARPLRFIEMSEQERIAAIKQDAAFAHIVCRCEQVSEAEVLEAMRAPIPATTVVGIKRRCRAGTGRCQGGFCEPVISEIMSRELGIGINEVLLQGPGSEVAPFLRGEVRRDRVSS